MQRFLFKKSHFRIVIISILFVLFLAPNITHAQQGISGWFIGEIGDQILASIAPAADRVLAIAGSLALYISSWILWLSGALLTLVMKYTVVNMSSTINGIAALDVAWKVFRDLANMFFIFILLYAAIGTILRLSGVNTKKIVVNVIIIALLINFSMFFTKVIIDASNILSTGFYNRITESAGGEENGLAGPFMRQMGLTSLYTWKDSVDNPILAPGTGKTTSRIFIIGTMGSIFLLVTAFVFFAANIMFVGRFVILIMLLILSPLAFASMALPKDKYSDMWWKPLINQAIFAPAFMALMWATLMILSGLSQAVPGQPGPSFAEIFSGTAENPPGEASIQLILNYFIVITMIVGCLIISKKIGAYGADSMMKRGQKLRGWAQGKVGRGTIGSLGAFADREIARGTFRKFANSRAGRFMREYTTGAAANATFGSNLSRKQTLDKVKDLKKDIKSKSREMELADTLKRGTKKPFPVVPDIRSQEARDQQELKLAQTIQRLSNADIDSLKASQITENIEHFSPSQLDHIINRSEKFSTEDKEKVRSARFKPINEAISTISSSTATPEQIAKAKEKIKGLSNKEVELAGSALISNEAFIQNLSGGHIENITKSDNVNFTANQKQNIRSVRLKPLKEGITSADPAQQAEARKRFKGMSYKDMTKLPSDILVHPQILPSYNPKMLLALRKQIEDPETQNRIREAIITRSNQIATLVSAGTYTPTPEDQEVTRTATWLTTGAGQDQF